MEFPLSLLQWMLASLVILGGALVQGSIGFGVALLGAPLLYLIEPSLIPGPMIIAGMSLPMLILAREWRAVHFPDAGWTVAGKAVGIALAGLVLGWIPENALGLVFGLLVLFGVALSAAGRIPSPRRPHMSLAGGLSGFMATTTSIGGPPLAIVFQGYPGARLRGTLSAVFIPGGVLSLLTLALVGRLGLVELALGLSLLPAIIVGFWLSGYTARALDRAWLRPALLAVSALAGFAAILQAILSG